MNHRKKRSFLSFSLSLFLLLSLAGEGDAASISGNVSYSGTQTGATYVAAFTSQLSCTAPNPDSNPFFYVEIPSPGNYTLSGLPDGTYYVVSVIMACGANCDLQPTDPWGIYNGCENITPVVISGGNAVSGIDITLVDGTAENPNPFYTKYDVSAFSGHSSDDYWVELIVDDAAHEATSVSVTGPGISTTLDLVYNAAEGYWASWDTPVGNPSFGATPPTPPLEYVFTITDPTGTTIKRDLVEGFVNVFATNLSPTGGEAVVGNPAFSWTGVEGNYRYGVSVNGEGIYWDIDNLNTTSVAYGGPPLTPGKAYNWDVDVRDVYGNFSITGGSFFYQGPEGAVQLASTGQVTCYHSAGIIIPCARSGQDGEIQAGAPLSDPRFTDNGEGTVTDNLTGLMWTKDANLAGWGYWQNALDYITGMNNGTHPNYGYTDWRLPNINEMLSLVDYGRYNPALPKDHPLVKVSGTYWTSTTRVDYRRDAMVIELNSGRLDGYEKDISGAYLWPVRGGQNGAIELPQTNQKSCYAGDSSGSEISCSGTLQDGAIQAGVAWPDPRFIDNGDGTNTDNLTGLIWLKNADCIRTQYPNFDKDSVAGDGGVTWQHALEFIEGINSGAYQNCGGGYTDWRLPNINEVRSLFNNHGAPDMSGWLANQAFSNIYQGGYQGFYWTSTTSAGSPSTARLISSRGGEASESKGSGYHVWPVRGGQIRSGPVTDDKPSTGSITIEGGAPSTTSVFVTLSLTAPGSDVTHIYISESSAPPSISDTGWVPVESIYNSQVPIRLSESSGIKTIYVWFRDALGNISPLVSDTIELQIMTGFWQEKTAGLYGGVITKIAINPSGHIFAGTSGGGVFRSTDNGETWKVVNNGLPITFINTLNINASGHIFAGGSGEVNTPYSSSIYGLFRSTDNGETWVPTGLMNTSIRSVAINSLGDIFASTNEWHTYRSSDNGETWTVVSNNAFDAMAINFSDHIFGVNGSNLYRSTDNGQTWTNTSTIYNTSINTIAINSAGHIFAGAGNGIYRSVDNGGSLVQINSGLTSTNIKTISVNSSGHIFAATWQGDIFRSTDNGDTWGQVGMTDAAVRSLINSPSDHLFAGTEQGVFRSTDDGGTWQQVNNGITSVRVSTVVRSSSDSLLAGTWYNGIYRSLDNGESWEGIGLTGIIINSIVINSSGHIFVSSSDPWFGVGTIHRSTNNGESWQQIYTQQIYTLSGNISVLAINSSGHIFASSGDPYGWFGGSIHRSTDNGETWQQISTLSGNISALAINSSGHIFAGTGSSDPWFGGGAIHRSTDNGETWQQISMLSGNVSALAINSSDHVFIAARGGFGTCCVLRSTDNGETWVSMGLENNTVVSLAIDPLGHIIAGTSMGGVFLSSDNGETWVNTGLTNRSVYSLSGDSSGYIFAGTDAGVFRGVQQKGDMGPRVLSHTPSGSIAPPFDHIDIHFNEGIDPGSFDTDDISITGPVGSIIPDSVSPLDDKNFRITFPAQSYVGIYRIAVGPHINDKKGMEMDQDLDSVKGEEGEDQYVAYLLIISAVRVIAHTPGGDQIEPVSEVSITFNKEIQEATFTNEDIKINGPYGSINITNGPVHAGGTTYKIGFDKQDNPGIYHVYVGPQIMDLDGASMDQDGDGIAGEPEEDRYDANFTILDTSGPQVVSIMPVGNISPSLDHIDIQFNEEIDSYSFSTDDVSITGPSGAIIPYSVSQLDNDSFRVAFPSQSVEGAYEIVVGPGITDKAGNAMDQDQDKFNGETFDDRYIAIVTIDNRGPEVITHSITGPQNIAVQSIDINFSEIIDPVTFTKEDVIVEGPGGIYNALDVSRIDGDTYRIKIPPREINGTYTVTVSPAIMDIAGNYMDQDGDGYQGESEEDKFRFEFVQALPDLIVSEILHPAETRAGQQIEVRWTVTNSGTGRATGEWSDTVYISEDGQAGSDVKAGQLQYTQSLEPGGSYTRAITISIPDGIEGQRWIVVKTDSEGELDEDGMSVNNTTIASPPLWVTYRPYPDLRVTEVIVSDTLSAGEKGIISWTVRNLGSGATSATYWNDDVHLSSDAAIDSNDIKLGSLRNADFLAPGESYTQTVDMVIPDSISRGAYYVLVKTDAGDKVEEFDLEGNNVGQSAHTAEVITPPPPFLTVTSMSVPEMIEPGSRPKLTWTVTNTGGKTIKYGWYNGIGWDDALALSRDEVYDANEDYWLGSHVYFKGVPLGPGKSYTHMASPERVIPPWEPGTYYLIFLPDTHFGADAYFGESIVGRSYGVAPVRLVIPNPPDLQVISISSPVLATSGQKINLNWTVKNTGTGNTKTTSWTDAIFLSTDQTLDGDDLKIGDIYHSGALDPGGIYEAVSVPINIPAGVEGDYYILIKTDGGNGVYESDESNNIRASDIPVTIELIYTDLQVQSATAPAAGVAGQKISVEWTVINAGSGSTAQGSWSDHIYLSKDETLDVLKDTLLGRYFHTGGLGSGITYSRTQDFILPARIEGTHYIFVVTDAETVVYEHNGEVNNAFQIIPSIEISDLAADLEVVNVTIPATGIAGKSISVDWAVINKGTATANAAWQDAFYLSSDTILDLSQDKLIATFERLQPLEVGLAYGPPDTVAITLPERIEGTYYLFFVTDNKDSVYEKGMEGNNAGPPLEISVYDPAPDLQVQSASAPVQGISGEFIAVDWKIENRGDNPAVPTWKDAIYLSEDTEFNKESDRLIGMFEHKEALGPGLTSGPTSGQALFLLPSRIAGPYYIFVAADAEGAVYEKGLEANNVLLIPAPITIINMSADLQVSSVEAPASATAGNAIPVSWSVENSGYRSTDESYWYDGVYISSDNIFNPSSDIELGLISHTGSMAPGTSYSQSGSFVLRQDIEGPYSVYVVTDVRRQVYEYERDDNNINTGSRQMAVKGVHADLKVSTLTAPVTAVAGSNVAIQWLVTNVGNDPTPGSAWEDTIYLSSDSTPGVDDTRLAVVKHNGTLDSGTDYSHTGEFLLPANLVGDFFIIVRTDSSPFNDIFEYRAEDNNILSAMIRIDPTPVPDLQVPYITAPETAWSGQSMRVEWTVTNSGAVRAVGERGFWYDSVYLSRDLYLDVNNDIHLGNVLFKGELAADNGSYTGSLDARLPVGVSGPYYIIISTDSNIPDHVFEREGEDNNVSLAGATVEINLTPPADLQVTDITPPLSGVFGEQATWAYVVTNTGTLPASGAWYDTLYLSSDREWDIGDSRIARIRHEGDVAPGESYTGVVTASIPAVTPGSYYVIAYTDILNDVRETDDTNNTGISTGMMTVNELELSFIQGISGTLASGQHIYFEVMPSSGNDLLISLTGDAATCAEVYAARGRIPTRSDYDFRAYAGASGGKELRMPGTEGSAYYILVYGYNCSVTSAPFEITASMLEHLVITEISVAEGANIGKVTTMITGAHFDPGIMAWLEDNSRNIVTAGTVLYKDSAHLSATFDLTGLTPGEYWLVLENPDGESDRELFNVIEGQSGELFANLLLPSLVRPGRPYTLTLEYGNIGNTDIPAPLIVVSAAEGALMRLFPYEEFHNKPIQVLGISDENPVDILPPGSRYIIEMEFKLTTTGYVPFFLKIMDKPDEPIDWVAVEAALRPAGVDSATWDPVLQNLKIQIGDTWGEYVQVLREDAVRLAMRGERTYDVRDLFGLEMSVAYGGAKGAVTGYVMEGSTGYAVTGATVIVYQTDGPGYGKAATDMDGHFIIEGLPAGLYALEVDGYILEQSIGVVVQEDTDLLNQYIYVIPGGEISGYVSANATPLEGAIVSVRGQNTGFVASARTDLVGAYQIYGLPEDTYTIIASTADYVEENRPGIYIGQGEIRNDMNFNLVKGGVITGTVTDAFTGQAIEGAYVLAINTDGTDHSVTTDVNGNYSITGLLAGEWEVYVTAEGFVRSERNAVVLEAQGLKNQDFALVPGASISGRITNNSGNPIADASVFARGIDGSIGSASTDGNGDYTITGLAQGIYSIIVQADSYVIKKQEIGELQQGEMQIGINLQLNEGILIAGKVTEKDGITPISGAEVLFQGRTGLTIVVITNDDGTFFNNTIAPDIYYLRTSAQGYSTSQQMIEVTGSGLFTDLIIQLSTGATISGVVTESDGITSIPGAIVELLSTNGALIAQTLTDNSGGYSFHSVPSNSYNIKVFHETFSFGKISLDIAGTTPIHIKSSAADGMLSGSVLTDSGVPIPGAKVTAILQGQDQDKVIMETETDYLGNYSLGSLVDGDYLCIVSSVSSGRVLQNVTINNSEHIQYDFSLSSPISISGLITDSETGLPVTNAAVWVFEASWEQDDVGVFSTSLPDGTFYITGLSPGTYIIKVQSNGYLLEERSLIINDNLTVEISLAKTGFTLSGKVQDTLSTLPISNAMIILEKNGFPVSYSFSDSTGNFLIYPLRPDDYTINIYFETSHEILDIAVTTDEYIVISLQLRDTIEIERSIYHESLSTLQSPSNSSILDNNSGLSMYSLELNSFIAAFNIPCPFFFPQRWCIILQNAQRASNDPTGYNLQDVPGECSHCSQYYAKAQGEIQLVNQLFEQWDLNRRNIRGVIFRDGAIVLLYGISAATDIASGIYGGLAVKSKIIARSEEIRNLPRARRIIVEVLDHSMKAGSLVKSIMTTVKSQSFDGSNYFNLVRDLNSELGLLMEGIRKVDTLKSISSITGIVGDFISAALNVYNAVNEWKYRSEQLKNVWEIEEQARISYESRVMIAIGAIHMLQNCLNGCDRNTPDEPPVPPDDGNQSGGGQDSGGQGGDYGTTGAGSHDPNDKLVSIGYGTLHHILNGQTIDYTIRFENDKEAGASAQLVTITDPLSKDLDWNTFELGDMHFGSHHIDVPEGLNYYFTRVDLRPEGVDLFVDIEGSFDPSTGIAKWTFTAIDPETGELTEDPLDGFLPPNISNHEGEGYVKFRIKPKPGLNTGTMIENVATIIFDWNEPMDTPLVFNTIDASSPSSEVIDLPPKSKTTFDVRWNGRDAEKGSGIASYDIYVSMNNGVYKPWLKGTTATGGMFTGEVGNTYAFYSVARDYVGNIEPLPLEPDAVTTVANFIHLRKGFNLISSPTDGEFIPDAYAFLRLIDNDGTKIEKVVRYNRSIGKIEEAFLKQDRSIGGDNFTIAGGEGLILYVKEDMDIELSQTICPELNLMTGLNWVGTPCRANNSTAFQILQTISDDTVVSSIQRFNPDTGRFDTAAYENGKPVGVNFRIVPGEGYFIYMKQERLGFRP